MKTIFKNYKYRPEYIIKLLKNYVYLNPGLTIVFNGEKFYSENGLKDLLEDNNNVEDMLYPIIHLRGVMILKSQCLTVKHNIQKSIILL